MCTDGGDGIHVNGTGLTQNMQKEHNANVYGLERMEF